MSPSARDDRSSSDDEFEPTWDALDDSERIDDTQWKDLVSDINRDQGFVPEMSSDEIRDALADDEEWQPPDPGPVGWRTASPLFMLGIVGLIGGITALVLSAFLFRGLPGYALIGIIMVILLSTFVLIRRLPQYRSPDDGDGAQV